MPVGTCACARIPYLAGFPHAAARHVWHSIAQHLQIIQRARLWVLVVPALSPGGIFVAVIWRWSSVGSCHQQPAQQQTLGVCNHPDFQFQGVQALELKLFCA